MVSAEEFTLMEEENAKAEQRQAARFAAKQQLARQNNSTKARQALRRIVAERLSHPLLDQFKSSEFAENPLAERESSFIPMNLSNRPPTREVDVPDASDSTDDYAQGLDDLVRMKQHVQANDPDGNGLDKDEFCRAVGEIWVSRTSQELARLFMQIDANSDGVVTWEELLTFLLQKDAMGDDEVNRYIRPSTYTPAAAHSAHSAPVTHVLRLEDKEKYLSVGSDATMRLWSVDTGQPTKTIELGEHGWAHDALYCDSQHKLVLATVRSRLVLYDTTSLRQQRSWRMATAATSLCVVEQPDLSKEWASCLLVGHLDGSVSIHEWGALQASATAKEELAPRVTMGLHADWVRRMRYVKEAGGLISCSDDATLKVHSLAARGDLRQRVEPLRSPAGKPIMAFAYSAGQAAVATCGLERHIHWWSLSMAEPVNTLYGHAAAVCDVAINEADHQLISLDTDGAVRVWCVRRSFAVLQVIESPEGQPRKSLLYDAAAYTLLVAHMQPEPLVGSFAPLHCAAAAKARRAPSAAGSHASRAASPSHASQGARSTSPTDEGAALVRVRRGNPLVGAAGSTTLAVSLAVDEGGTVRCYHCADGDDCFRFQLADKATPASASDSVPGGDTPSAIGFDHSGRRLLVGRRDGKVKVYNFSSGAMLAVCHPPVSSGPISTGGAAIEARHEMEVTAVKGFKDNGRAYIVAAGWSQDLWNPNCLASGGYDETVLLWSFGSGKIRGRLVHERQGVTRRPTVATGSTGSGAAASAAGSGLNVGRSRAGRSSRPAATIDFVRRAGDGGALAVERMVFLHLESETSFPLLLTAASDGLLRLWSATSSQLLQVLPHTPPPGVYSSPACPITTIQWSAKEMMLLIGDESGRVALWECSSFKPALSGQQIPMSTMVALGMSQTGSREGSLGAMGNKERIYRCMRPHRRWAAHDSRVLSAAIIAAQWSGLVPPDARRASGDAADDGGGVRDGTPLLLTAALEGDLRLWTLDGVHIGTFSQDEWRVVQPHTYAPTPPETQEEPPRSWVHPASLEASLEAAATATPTISAPSVDTASTAFLTALPEDADESRPPPAAVRAGSVGGKQSPRRPVGGIEASETLREALLQQQASLGGHTMLTSTQAASVAGLPHGGRRPAIPSALGQGGRAVSLPILPPLNQARVAAPMEDHEETKKRAGDRARAQLISRFRHYQAQRGVGDGTSTVHTDLFFKQRDEARRNPRAHASLEVKPLTTIVQRRFSPKKERMGSMNF